jgi:hypothetical protein
VFGVTVNVVVAPTVLPVVGTSSVRAGLVDPHSSLVSGGVYVTSSE